MLTPSFNTDAPLFDTFFWVVHALILTAFALYGLFFLVGLLRNRNRYALLPPSPPGKAVIFGVRVLEIGLILAECTLLFGVSIPFWWKQAAGAATLPDQAVTVRVVAQQFAWNIHYPGKDNIFGRAEARYVDPLNNPLGLDPEDPHAVDDIVLLNELHLPYRRPCVLYITSLDVIHGFGIPALRIQRDAVPGMSQVVTFTAEMPSDTTTNAPQSPLEIVCHQLCGQGHYRMRGLLYLHEPAEFQAWLESQIPFGDGL
jgi:cytochrome c oxidase subunit 2